jgi:uncharacterized protein (DUF58 family)
MSESAGSARARRWWLRDTARRLSRLNHILIPDTKPERDRLRRRGLVRLLGAPFWILQGLSREGRILLLLAFGVGCAGLDVRFTQIHQLFAMLAGLLVAALLLRPFFRASGAHGEVRGPDRVAVGAPARFDVQVVNRGQTLLQSLRVRRPFLPWDGKWHGRPDGVAALEPGAHATVSATATFAARGEHHLDSFEICTLLPLGLSVGPRQATAGTRFLVVPKVASVSSVTLKPRLPSERDQVLSSVQPGESDLAGVRPYRAGDELKHIHARTWARTGTPHVRQYTAERSDRVSLVVLVDGSAVSELTKEAALSLAAGVAARLALHEGGLDWVQLNDESFVVRPRSGPRALDAVLDRLAVHSLTTRKCSALGALRDGLAATSALVLISAGVTPCARQLVAAAHLAGTPFRWAAVTESEEPVEGATVVGRQVLEAGKEISL